MDEEMIKHLETLCKSLNDHGQIHGSHSRNPDVIPEIRGAAYLLSGFFYGLETIIRDQISRAEKES